MLRIVATAIAVAAAEMGAVNEESKSLDCMAEIWDFGCGGVCCGFGAVVPVDAAEKNANGEIAVAMLIDFCGFGFLVHLVRRRFSPYPLFFYFSLFFKLFFPLNLLS